MKKSSPRFRFTGAAVLLAALIFLVPALREGDSRLYTLAAAVPAAMLLSATVLARLFSLDRLLLSVSLLLLAAGIAALAMTDPDAAMAQALRCGAALAALLVGAVLIRSLSPSLLTSLCGAFLGLLALSCRLLVRDWSVPLAEAAMALLLISFASLQSRQGTVVALLAGIAGLGLLLAGRETMPALLWALALLLLVFISDGRPVVLLPALAAVLLLFFGAGRLYPGMFRFESPGVPETLLSAGPVGADALPGETAAETLSLFPLLAGRFGLIFAGLVSLLFVPVMLRGNFTASTARTRFHAVLAAGVTLLLSLAVLASLLSSFGLFSAPGFAFPLLTGSLPALCAWMFMVGLLCGVSARNASDLAEDAHLAMLAG